MKLLRFKDWNILPKIVTISLMSVVIIDAVILFYFLPLIEEKALEWDKRGVQHVVDIAYSLVAEYDKQVQQEIMPLFEAQLRAAADLQGLRYSKNEYFWISDQSPKIIMHPIKSELEGKDASDIKDWSGKPIFKEFVRVTRETGSGFVSYSWPKPGEETPSRKVSYVRLYKPWGWIIGSGIYTDQVVADINRIRSQLMLATGLFALLSILIAYYIGRGITRPLHEVITGLRNIARSKEEAGSKRLAVKASDEIGLLTSEFNGLMHSMGKVSLFKKMIEEDDSTSDVYARLGSVFKEDLGLPRFTICETSSSDTRMNPVFSEPAEGELHCDTAVQGSWALCKAMKTGHPVSSTTYPKPCLHFSCAGGERHHCFPLSVGGSNIGVVQFILEGETEPERPLQVEEALLTAGQYIKESLPALETKRLLAELRMSSLTDPMTGLHNRRFLEECIDHMVASLLRRKKQMALAMCDLDFFKEVNDQHGHDTGDSVLKETALALKSCVREADIVIRFGGEEFLVLLLDVEEGSAQEVVERIRSRIEGTAFRIAGGYLKKTLSIGFSEFPRDTNNVWQAIKFADVALYRAKETGRNRSVRFTSDMWSESEEEQERQKA